MKEAGASDEELKVLDKAIDTSDTQHKLQTIAFAAMQGLYDPEKAEFVTGGDAASRVRAEDALRRGIRKAAGRRS